jgi:hypothetical protein
MKGTTYNHVIACLRTSRSSDPIVNLSILLHDIAKNKSTYKFINGKHSYHGHEGAGVPIVYEIGQRMKFPTKDIQIMAYCAENHMRVHKIYDMSKSKIVAMVNHPFWPYLKEVGYADEMCRGFTHSNVDAFNEKIKYAEDLANQFNQGRKPDALQQQLKQLLDGNKLMQWIPEIKQRENLPKMKQVMQIVYDQIVDSGTLEYSEDEVKEMAIAAYQKL